MDRKDHIIAAHEQQILERARAWSNLYADFHAILAEKDAKIAELERCVVTGKQPADNGGA